LKKSLKILIAQPEPNNVNSPFNDLAKKHNIKINYKPFLSIEGETVKNIRIHKINVPSYGALILTSRNAVNHYFRICDEMRINVPSTLKYFCISEAVSYYLQKYIAYRKRKIYSANNNYEELIDIMKKHEDEKFLFVSSDFVNSKLIDLLDNSKLQYKRGVFFKTVSNNLAKLKINSYNILVFYSPLDINALYDNFKDFKQNEIKIAAFGKSTHDACIEKGLTVDIVAPSPKYPSMSMALHSYLIDPKNVKQKK